MAASMDDLTRAITELRTEIHSLKQELVGSSADQLLTTTEAARFAHVGRHTILAWTKIGLPYRRSGKNWTFLKSELLQFIETHFRTTPEPFSLRRRAV